MISVPSPLRRHLAWLPAVLALLCYAPVIGFDYVWDDYFYLAESERLHSWQAAWQAAFSPYLGTDYYFRPLGILSLALGPAALAHALNVLLHAANSTLLTLLVRSRLPHGGGSPAAALAAGLLYALHPALIETVAWVSCRFDLLLTFFSLLFLHLAARAPAPRTDALLAACFLLAALSKESAVVLPLLYLLWRAPQQQAWRTLAVLAAAGLLYLALRAAALDGLHVRAAPSLEPVQQVLLALKSLGFYLSLSLLPFFQVGPLHLLELPLRLDDPHVLLGLAGLALAAMLWRHLQATPRLLLAGYFIALLPVLNLLRLGVGESFAHDRLLSLPLALLCALAGLGFAAVFSRRRLAGSALLLLWLALALVTLQKVLPAWRDNLSLWTWAARQAPQSDLAHNNLLSSLNQRQRHAEAIAHAQGLEQARGGELSVAQRLAFARALGAVGEKAAALAQLDRIVAQHGRQMGTDVASLCAEKAWMHMELGELALAERLLRATLDADRTDTEAAYHLGAVLVARGRVDEGRAQLQQALEATPPGRRERRQAQLAELIGNLRLLAAQTGPPAAAPAGALLEACARLAAERIEGYN